MEYFLSLNSQQLPVPCFCSPRFGSLILFPFSHIRTLFIGVEEETQDSIGGNRSHISTALK